MRFPLPTRRSRSWLGSFGPPGVESKTAAPAFSPELERATWFPSSGSRRRRWGLGPRCASFSPRPRSWSHPQGSRIPWPPSAISTARGSRIWPSASRGRVSSARASPYRRGSPSRSPGVARDRPGNDQLQAKRPRRSGPRGPGSDGQRGNHGAAPVEPNRHRCLLPGDVGWPERMCAAGQPQRIHPRYYEAPAEVSPPETTKAITSPAGLSSGRTRVRGTSTRLAAKL